MGGLKRTILVTGASAGLGRALAFAYAQTGVTLGLIGRDEKSLQSVGDRCLSQGAAVELGKFDVTDRPAVNAWIEDFTSRHAIDLLIVNAGIFAGNGPHGEMESFDEAAKIIRTNLEGAVSTITSALPSMRKNRFGRIAIIGSLSALHPLADAPAYSSSKAGLMAYGEALRECLAPDNISVTLVYPGHIATKQVTNHVGPVPLLLSPRAAANLIQRGIDRNHSFIAFPQRLYWVIRIGRVLPWRLRAWLGQGQRFYVRQPLKYGRSLNER